MSSCRRKKKHQLPQKPSPSVKHPDRVGRLRGLLGPQRTFPLPSDPRKLGDGFIGTLRPGTNKIVSLGSRKSFSSSKQEVLTRRRVETVSAELDTEI
ncbi:hypothetical protein ElyMa_001766800 [Elysia marginata]|uniref:Uncharacterized protein n=1 Tax=Elysia marginata TaxID=1093978 RepID=A0AAV4ECD1_9GAST|nr:hypothetical protein ElyMa_001766800 [Elysia marginata]